MSTEKDEGGASYSAIFIGAMIGMAAANYLYQWFGRELWEVAFERSFFQAVAIANVWLGFILSDRLLSARKSGGGNE